MKESKKNQPPIFVSDKVLAMRAKIQDASYVDNAVQRIALVLSRKIVEKPREY